AREALLGVDVGDEQRLLRAQDVAGRGLPDRHLERAGRLRALGPGAEPQAHDVARGIVERERDHLRADDRPEALRDRLGQLLEALAHEPGEAEPPANLALERRVAALEKRLAALEAAPRSAAAPEPASPPEAGLTVASRAGDAPRAPEAGPRAIRPLHGPPL